MRACGIDEAEAELQRQDGYRFMPLLHQCNVSNWILHSHAYGGRIAARVDRRVAKVDTALRESTSELTWLSDQWLASCVRGAARRGASV